MRSTFLSFEKTTIPGNTTKKFKHLIWEKSQNLRKFPTG